MDHHSAAVVQVYGKFGSCVQIKLLRVCVPGIQILCIEQQVYFISLSSRTVKSAFSVSGKSLSVLASNLFLAFSLLAFLEQLIAGLLRLRLLAVRMLPSPTVRMPV